MLDSQNAGVFKCHILKTTNVTAKASTQRPRNALLDICLLITSTGTCIFYLTNSQIGCRGYRKKRIQCQKEFRKVSKNQRIRFPHNRIYLLPTRIQLLSILYTSYRLCTGVCYRRESHNILLNDKCER